jgi:hypothetical protein
MKPAGVACLMILKQLFAVQKERDRAVVYYKYLHFRLKNTGSDPDAVLLHAGNKLIIICLSNVGRSSIGKRWASAFAAISKERELRNNEHLTTRIMQAAIHFAISIFKRSQVDDFRDQIVKVLICIICSNAQENEKPGANSAYFSAGNAHCRLFYSLYNCTHCFSSLLNPRTAV